MVPDASFLTLAPLQTSNVGLFTLAGFDIADGYPVNQLGCSNCCRILSMVIPREWTLFKNILKEP